MRIHKLLPIVNSNLFFITPILHSILNILALFLYQVLLASLLKVIGSVNSYNIILNLTQTFSISIKIREYPNNIVVKNIKNTPPFRPRLLKLQVSNKKLSKDKKAYFNTTTALNTHISITKTKSIKSHVIHLITCL